MYRFKLYNSDEIEALQKELHVYRNALETMNIGDLIEKYMKAKSEVYSLKYDLLKQEGDINKMKEFFREAIEKYEKAELDLSAQIQAVNDSLNQLKEDVHWIKNQVDQIDVTEFIEKKNDITNQHVNNVYNEKSEIDLLKEEVSKLKELMTQNNNKKEETVNHPHASNQSEYRRLQNMLQSSHLTQSQPQAQSNLNLPPTQNFNRPTSSMSNYTGVNPSFTQNSNRSGRARNSAQFDLINKTIIRSKKTANPQEFKKVNNNSAQTPNLQAHKTETTNSEKHAVENNSEDDHDRNFETTEKLETNSNDMNEQEYNLTDNQLHLDETQNSEEIAMEQEADNNATEQTSIDNSNSEKLDNMLPNQEINSEEVDSSEEVFHDDNLATNNQPDLEVNNEPNHYSEPFPNNESLTTSSHTDLEDNNEPVRYAEPIPNNESVSTSSHTVTNNYNEPDQSTEAKSNESVSTNIQTKYMDTNENQVIKTFFSLFKRN